MFDSKVKFMKDLRDSLKRAIWTHELEVELAAIQINHEERNMQQINKRMDEADRKERERLALGEKEHCEKNLKDAQRMARIAADKVRGETSKLLFVLEKLEEISKWEALKAWVRRTVNKLQIASHFGGSLFGGKIEKHNGFEIRN